LFIVYPVSGECVYYKDSFVSRRDFDFLGTQLQDVRFSGQYNFKQQLCNRWNLTVSHGLYFYFYATAFNSIPLSMMEIVTGYESVLFTDYITEFDSAKVFELPVKREACTPVALNGKLIKSLASKMFSVKNLVRKMEQKMGEPLPQRI